MPPVLRLYEDTLANDGAEHSLPARPYVIYVVHVPLAVLNKSGPLTDAMTVTCATDPTKSHTHTDTVGATGSDLVVTVSGVFQNATGNAVFTATVLNSAVPRVRSSAAPLSW